MNFFAGLKSKIKAQHHPHTKVLNPLRSNRGVSLYEVIVATGLSTFVAFGAAYIIGQSFRDQTTATRLNTVDTEHLLMLQRARSATFVSRQLNLINADGSPNTANQRFADCLAGTSDPSIDCRQFGGETTIQVFDPETGSN